MGVQFISICNNSHFTYSLNFKSNELYEQTIETKFCCSTKGPSIYDVHTKGEGGQAQVDACGRGGPAPCGRPHRKLLSSSHAKKLASFLPEFRLWTEKSGNFSAI